MEGQFRAIPTHAASAADPSCCPPPCSLPGTGQGKAAVQLRVRYIPSLSRGCFIFERFLLLAIPGHGEGLKGDMDSNMPPPLGQSAL